MYLKICLDVKYKLLVLMVIEYIVWIGEKVYVYFWLFIGFFCKILYF